MNVPTRSVNNKTAKLVYRFNHQCAVAFRLLRYGLTDFQPRSR